MFISCSMTAPPAGSKKPFADVSPPVFGDTPIDAAPTADDYLPLRASNPNRKAAVNNESVEEAVLKRSHMAHKH